MFRPLTIFLTPSKRNITHGLRTQHNGGNIIFRRERLDIWHPTAVNGQQQYATAATAKDNISLNVGTVSLDKSDMLKLHILLREWNIDATTVCKTCYVKSA
jgi:hypothetical protein